MKKIALVLILLMTGCAYQGQNNYNSNEVGKEIVVQFGTVLSEHEVAITGQNTGGGATVGALGGAAAGAGIGHSGVGVLAGLLIGGIAGAVAEQEAANHIGIAYTITLENRKTVVIVQNQNKDDEVFRRGARVMIQTQGGYKRVLSAEDLPEAIAKPKSVHLLKQPKNPAYEPDPVEEDETQKEKATTTIEKKEITFTPDD